MVEIDPAVGGFFFKKSPGAATPSGAVSGDQDSMTTHVTPTERSTVPDGAARVGVDGEGRTHYWAFAPYDNRVFVVPADRGVDGDDSDAATVDVFDLDATPCDGDLGAWIDHVARQAGGWERLERDHGLTDLVAEAV